MAEPPVVNSSPLIVHAHAGFIDLLQGGGERVLVPDAVQREIEQYGPDDPAARALQDLPWLEVVHCGHVAADVAACRLDAGESDVLTWALTHPGAIALLDDLAGRRCAARLGISVVGTLGLIVDARLRGAIPAARPVVEAIRRAGLYLSDQVIDRALSKVGE
ncbi:MAG: DUF3368 domain-containing protein [Dehalococcoidia bacterium]